MLRRAGWRVMTPPVARDNLSARFVERAGYAWAALMIALGVLQHRHRRVVPISGLGVDQFVSVGATGIGIVAFLIQYALMRTAVRAQAAHRTRGLIRQPAHQYRHRW